MSTISNYIRKTFKHFNAATVIDAADAWKKLLNDGGKMLVTMGGAMSTSEIGITLAELIRKDYVHSLCVTGANLEEDIFNLVAHNEYKRIPNYRDLTPAQEKELHSKGFNRVTDTCIPEEEALRRVESKIKPIWKKVADSGEKRFPHEFLYELLRSGVLESDYQIDPQHSWLIAASEKNIPIWTPGWEDSTLGNILVAATLKNEVPNGRQAIKSGLDAMAELVPWYEKTSEKCPVGFFQIGGGITGDFPICVVPLIEQDMRRSVRKWAYFCQIADSTTSYGSYSGATPNEKITWGKLTAETAKFVIESDATIVFPLIAALLLDV